MKLKPLKNLRVRLVLMFCLITFLAAVCSFIVSNIITYAAIESEARKNQGNLAEIILQLNENTGLSASEIASLTSTTIYPVDVLYDVSAYKAQSKLWDQLENSNSAFLRRWFAPIGTTLVQLDDGYIEISLDKSGNVFLSYGLRTGLTLIFAILFGLLFIFFYSGQFLKPLRRLNKATQEVAKGNFDISLPVEHDDEINTLTKNFNKMTKELQSMEVLRKDFISTVSHEYKTPIASIQGFARLLQSGNLQEEEKQEYLDIIVEETERLSRLSYNILELARLENQEIVSQKQKFSLDEQLRRTIVLLEPEWNAKQLDLQINLDKSDYLGNEEQLQRVWGNLLSNAIKFTPTGGKIKISLISRRDCVSVCIADNGIGIDDTALPHIFEKFYQTDKEHAAQGVGLGLSLVKRIVDLNGGSIKVESKVGQGSSFTVTLPVYAL